MTHWINSNSCST